MKVADTLALVDEALGTEGRASLRSPAKRAEITAAAGELGTPLPPSLRALYEWHDGESATSLLFDEILHEDFEEEWSTVDEGPLEVRFMRLEDVKRAGAIAIWIDSAGQASRSIPTGEAKQTVAIPFVWIRSATDEEEDGEPREAADHDWFLAVDALREAVWLVEGAGEGLEGIVEDEASLGAWLEVFAAKAGHVRDEIEQGTSAENAQHEPAVMLVRFMLDRKLVELSKGTTVEHVARKLAPLLALTPPKRAVRAVLDQLADDDTIDEVFADDELLAKVVVEFVA